ncbi:CreA family protein [Pokkaliibacter sp. MBI-7]|uniref:CreA family protein n=1 Tax=Pokkaliibacter sp. MBI-7 TaxID=3040600 RepID=UPI0032673F22
MKSWQLSTVMLTAVMALGGCSDKNEVGDVSLGLFTTKDIKLEMLSDPKIEGVTCYISHIKADLDLADPSDMSIACRQTGPITLQMLQGIDRSKSGEVIFSTSKSVLFKSLKVRRIYDETNRTLLYVSYSTKESNGSPKHSLSAVPLWGNPVWEQLEQQKREAQSKN